MDKTFDIAICGAGPAGLSLALFLLKNGINPVSIVLLDAKTKEQTNADARTIALSCGSHQFLQSIKAAPTRSTPINQIHVSRSGHFGKTLIDREQQNVSALGYVARYADIVTPLLSALEQHQPAPTFLRPAKVVDITQSETEAQIHLDDGRTLQSRIVVQAEGGVFGEQALQTRHHDYQQSAIIASVKTSKPIAGRAFERFTDQGPLALLPQDEGYALVWCVRPELAPDLMAANDVAFLKALQEAFGERLGQFTATTPRAVFALGLNAQTGAPTGRTICIGNAAQTLHPVAGQGLNLGLRDAYVLAQCLSKEITPKALQDFFQLQNPDRQQTIRLTDQLAQRFTRQPGTGAVAHVTQSLFAAGLSLIDILPPAQDWLAEQMMFGKR